jgi:hypothetical protein
VVNIPDSPSVAIFVIFFSSSVARRSWSDAEATQYLEESFKKPFKFFSILFAYQRSVRDI